MAITAITKNIIVIFVQSTATDNPKNSGLNVPNTENPITCLNAVTISEASVKVSKSQIKLIGIQFAIKLSIK